MCNKHDISDVFVNRRFEYDAVHLNRPTLAKHDAGHVVLTCDSWIVYRVYPDSRIALFHIQACIIWVIVSDGLI